MKRNVGGLDERARKTLGPLVLAAAVVSLLRARNREGRPALAVVGLAVGSVLTATGLTRRCPANSAIGRDTTEESGLSDEARRIRERALQ